MDNGTAGRSAHQEYERRLALREQRLDQKWGRLSGIAKALGDVPQSTTAWKIGASGEVRVARHLEKYAGDVALFLHDRKVPGRRGNIDHLAIASSGVWIIDSKNYKGKVEHRDVGGFFKTDLRLYVNGRDRSDAAHGLHWQVDAVRMALADKSVEVHPTVCFVEAEWGMFSKSIHHDGVLVTWAAKLVELIREPGSLTPDDVHAVTQELAHALPAMK